MAMSIIVSHLFYTGTIIVLVTDKLLSWEKEASEDRGVKGKADRVSGVAKYWRLDPQS